MFPVLIEIRPSEGAREEAEQDGLRVRAEAADAVGQQQRVEREHPEQPTRRVRFKRSGETPLDGEELRLRLQRTAADAQGLSEAGRVQGHHLRLQCAALGRKVQQARHHQTDRRHSQRLTEHQNCKCST